MNPKFAEKIQQKSSVPLAFDITFYKADGCCIFQLDIPVTL